MAQTLLTEPAALLALYRITESDLAVDQLVRRYRSWEELAESTPYSRASQIGAWAAGLRVPAHCPPMGPVGAGVVVVSRYHANRYPGAFSRMAVPPVLLWLRGEFPNRACVAVGGCNHPSVEAIRRARAAAYTACGLGYGVVGVVDGGCGRAALAETIRMRGVGLGVIGGFVGAVSRDIDLVEGLLEGGGGVVSARPPGTSWSEMRLAEASELVGALGDVVVVAEFGPRIGGGLSLVQSALVAGRPLVAFEPPVAGVALGASNLLVRGAKPVDVYGQLDLPPELISIPRASARAMAGQTIADAVVGDLQGLRQAIRGGGRR